MKSIRFPHASRVVLLFYCYVLVLGAGMYLTSYPSINITDEFSYVLMTKALVEEGYLDIWNGLNEYKPFSWEYVPHSTQPIQHGNAVVLIGNAPLFYSFVAAPFYWLFGRQGPQLMNLFSFLATTALIYHFVVFVFRNQRFALLSAVSFSIMTFSHHWATSTIPHGISTFLLFASFFGVVYDYRNGGAIFRGILLFFVGLASTLTIGLRLSNGIFIVLLYFFVLVCVSLRKSSLFIFGSFWPIVSYLLLNAFVFGSPFETTQGNLFTLFETSALPFLVVIIFVGGLSLFFRSRLTRPSNQTILLGFIVVLGVLFFTDNIVIVPRILAYLFDMQNIHLFGITQYLYPSYPAKALFQSSPFLILSFIGPIIMWQRRVDPRIISFVALFAWSMIVTYGARSHYGGDGLLNLRYFSESLPYLCILSMAVVEDVLSRISHRRAFFVGVCVGVTVFLVFAYPLAFPGGFDWQTFDFPSPLLYKVIYYVVLTLLAIHMVLFYVLRRKALPYMVEVFGVLIFLSFAYALLITHADDLTRSIGVERTYVMGKTISGIVENDSAVFYHDANTMPFLLELKLEKKVRVLNPEADLFADMHNITTYYVERDVPVYYLVRTKHGRLLDEYWLRQVSLMQGNFSNADVKTINIEWPYRIN